MHVGLYGAAAAVAGTIACGLCDMSPPTSSSIFWNNAASKLTTIQPPTPLLRLLLVHCSVYYANALFACTARGFS